MRLPLSCQPCRSQPVPLLVAQTLLSVQVLPLLSASSTGLPVVQPLLSVQVLLLLSLVKLAFRGTDTPVCAGKERHGVAPFPTASFPILSLASLFLPNAYSCGIGRIAKPGRVIQLLPFLALLVRRREASS